MPRRRRARRLPPQKRGTLRLAAVFALLVGVNVYVFFFSSGKLSKVSEAVQTASTAAPPPLAPAHPPPAPKPKAAQPAPAPHAGAPPAPLQVAPARPARPKRPVDGTVRDGEGLGSILRREALPSTDSDAVIRALQPVMDFKKEIRAGQRYSIRLDADGRLERFELKAAAGTLYSVVRGEDGKLVGKKTTR